MHKRIMTEKKAIMPDVLMPWIIVFAVIGLITAGIFSYMHFQCSRSTEGSMLEFVRIDNDEVLDLTWKMQKQYQNDGNDYSYKVLLYDSQQKPKIELTVVPSADSDLWTCPAVIYDYRAGTVATKSMMLTFAAGIDKNGQMHLVLDAVDDTAGEMLSGACSFDTVLSDETTADEAAATLSADAFSGTLSAMRFWLLSGLDLTDHIYAKIAVVDAGGSCSRWLETDAVHFLMANDSDAAAQTYRIYNARHLYNIRFMEVLTADSTFTVTYEQMAEIVWSGDDSFVSRGHVYHSGSADADISDVQGFLTIPALSSHTLFVSHDYPIVNLILYARSDGAFLGLVGTNRGTISGLRLENVSVTENPQVSAKAAGAVCAVNDGLLENNSVSDSSVAGADYVGGITGVIMPGAQMRGCVFEGGTVSGRDFVGGLAGINHSSEVLTGEVLEASPQLVSGRNFVGGLIGGNMVLVDDAHPQMTLNAHMDAENGTVSGSGVFVGGILGTNVLFRSFNEAPSGGFPADAVLEAMACGQSTADADSPAPDTVNTVDTAFVQAAGKTADVRYKLVITAPEELLDSYGSVILDRVEGQMYVGGVIGYQVDDSRLEITDIRMNADISAASAEDTEDGPVSYAGAITGLVPENTMISHCTVAREVQIEHRGHYRGLIAEMNKGWIVRCEAVAYGDADTENIGGIAGINTASGRICACRLTGTLTGSDNVGGMASLNQGWITGCVIYGDVEGQGSHIGGAAGKNSGTIMDTAVNKSVRGGSGVGGIIGHNTGSVHNCTVESGGIYGDSYVGGFVGYQADRDADDDPNNAVLSGLYNVTEVYAGQYAGGIIGYSDGTVTMTDCGNDAVIYSNDGYAGGITAYNGVSSVIRQCSVTAGVEAPNACSIGSVCGVNAGRIEQCSVAGDFKLTGSSHIGGITGINFGEISLSTIAQVDAALQGGTKDSSVGGIAGSNLGTIATSGSPVILSADAQNAVRVTSNTNGSYVGGVAGYNAGVINGLLPSEVQTTMFAQVITRNKASAYIGGIAGKNNGEITGYIFSGYVETTGYEGFGTGGIAGVNGSDGNNDLADALRALGERFGIDCDASVSEKSVIAQCEVSDLRLHRVAFNDRNSSDTNKYTVYTSNAENVCTGGIVGFNCSDGQITGAIPVLCYIRGDYGYTGGIAGLNLGSIESCKASDARSENDGTMNVKIYNKEGYAGGIAGMNGMGGSISRCATGASWLILQASQSTGSAEDAVNAAGGIIGCNTAIRSIYNVENYAVVKKTDDQDDGVTGGIVGIQKCLVTASWKLMQCVNYGEVTGGSHTGAVIGEWLMFGGNVVQCENYGIVSATGGSAGMIGSICSLTSGTTVNIESCINFGTIRADVCAGGIVGAVDDNGPGSMIMIHACSNAGPAEASDGDMGGIVGTFSGSGASVSIDRCVNYYRPQYEDFNGIAAYNIFSEVTLCMNIPYGTAQSSSQGFNAIGSARYLGYDNLNFTFGIFDIENTDVINQGDSIPLIVYFHEGRYQASNAAAQTVMDNLPYDPNSTSNRAKSAQMLYEDFHEIVGEFLNHVHNTNEKLHTMD